MAINLLVMSFSGDLTVYSYLLIQSLPFSFLPLLTVAKRTELIAFAKWQH